MQDRRFSFTMKALELGLHGLRAEKGQPRNLQLKRSPHEGIGIGIVLQLQGF